MKEIDPNSFAQSKFWESLVDAIENSFQRNPDDNAIQVEVAGRRTDCDDIRVFAELVDQRLKFV
ncbi:hypothetical protein [Brevibacterium sp. RIT 803]|uniref:hypothetical protein n=1 Tax=Brevibacterium sp. RIT 803 TaxID=2810210 RepID=UPI00194F7D90|nr:hypothetical protein [Brevibacterium sp. RIT 803]MBM6591551.1 hypothetical protein [Brevibacterium sp. RIT 803]